LNRRKAMKAMQSRRFPQKAQCIWCWQADGCAEVSTTTSYPLSYKLRTRQWILVHHQENSCFEDARCSTISTRIFLGKVNQSKPFTFFGHFIIGLPVSQHERKLTKYLLRSFLQTSSTKGFLKGNHCADQLRFFPKHL